MDGLETVAHVGQRAADDHRHGVVQVRRLHLVFERAWLEAVGQDVSRCHISPVGS